MQNEANPPIFSIITPSRGNRPRALAQAIASVAIAIQNAGDALTPTDVEMLVGFDGVKGERMGPGGTPPPDFVRFFDLPFDGNYGNAIRSALLKASKGRFIILLDDDNMLTPEAFTLYLQGLEHEIQVGFIDVSRAFETPILPIDIPGKDLLRQGNIDPLSLCLSRELVMVFGNGWSEEGGYESDYINIRRYWRRAKSIRRIDAFVGIYDAGLGLDKDGANLRQQQQVRKS